MSVEMERKGNNMVDIVKSEEEVVLKLGKFLEFTSGNAIRENGNFKIGVSGGSLVGMLRKALPNVQTAWDKWVIFFCDERVVPESDPESTFGTYKAKILDVVPIKESQFIKINQSLKAEEAAKDYEMQLKNWFSGELPIFDMLLLGMGPDGHTCSLFPGHEALKATSWVTHITDSPKPPPCRISLTLPVLNASAMCIFPICGAGKAATLKAILHDKKDLPASRVKPKKGLLVWLLDSEAAKDISAL